MARARDEKHDLTVELERGWLIARCGCGKWSDMCRPDGMAEITASAGGYLGHLVKIGKLKPEAAWPPERYESESRAAVHTGSGG